MRTQLPGERTLPDRRAMLDRILAAEPVHARRRTWAAPLAAAASVSLVAGGFVVGSGVLRDTTAPAGGVVTGTTSEPERTATPPTARRSARPAVEPTVDLDLGPIDAEEAREFARDCLAEASPGADVAEVTHAVRVRDWGRPNATDLTVVVLDRQERLLRACVGEPTATSRSGEEVPRFEHTVVGGDADAARRYKIVVNSTDATHPAAPTEGNSAQSSVRFDDESDLIGFERWYRVDNRVTRMRQRIILNGKAGPWYVADAADGLVFLRSWSGSTALRKDNRVRVETQTLDRNGGLLDAPGDQKGGGGLTPSPGTTKVERGIVVQSEFDQHYGSLEFSP